MWTNFKPLTYLFADSVLVPLVPRDLHPAAVTAAQLLRDPDSFR